MISECDCIIVGAGLAGCHTARALADTGKRVLLLEKAATVATAASGNLAGIIQPLLNRTEDIAVRFYNRAFLECLPSEFYKSARTGPAGVLYLTHNKNLEDRIKHALRQPLLADHCKEVSQSEASACTGLQTTFGGVFFSGAGLVRPRVLCQELILHPQIESRFFTEALEFEYLAKPKTWLVVDANRNTYSAPVLVLAQASEAIKMQACAWLPIYTVRGQLLYLPGSDISAKLQCTVTYDGYTTPLLDEGLHVVGATFEHKNTDKNLIPAQQLQLFDRLQAVLPDFQKSSEDIKNLPGRVAFRTTSRDRLPLIGPVPDADLIQKRLRLDPNLREDMLRSQSVSPFSHHLYHTGLYVNLAHGSRGLTGCMLAAQIIRDLIQAQSGPADKSAQLEFKELWPERFLWRRLRKNENLI